MGFERMLKFKQSKYSSIKRWKVTTSEVNKPIPQLPVEGSSVTQVWCIITQ